MTERNASKVVVAMSGGVDSSVTAALLQEQGYEVVGCFMRLGSDDSVEEAMGYDNMADHCATSGSDPGEDADIPQASDNPKVHKQGCCSVNDASDARLVAAKLGMPFYVLNFKKDFGRIIDYFVGEYNAGRTPNPCVRCNDWLKFGKLHTYARSIDADYVATGHYARIAEVDNRRRLLQGKDHRKDQSYVLFGTPREQLEHMLLPIGEFEKSHVRELAQQYNLPVFNKPDSQEICFVPDNDYARLVKRRSGDAMQPGKIIDTSGKTVGEHEGHQHFTIGQRRGVGVALGYPIYVVDRQPQTNTVVIGGKEDLLALGCTADQTNWLIEPPTDWTPAMVKIRYNSPPTPGSVRATGDDALEVRFDEPVEAVTPGQAVVCYDGDAVMGGGWIDAVDRTS